MRHPNTLDPAKTALVIVDLQDAFRPVIHGFESVVARTVIVAQAFKLLSLPILLTEQVPQKLGATVEEIKSVLPPGVVPVDKTAFSSCGAGYFTEQLKGLRQVKQIVLCGIETHVCMNQTAHDLMAAGYQVHVPLDCTSSRTPQNRQAGLDKMILSHVLPSSSEMALFELMGDARHEQFKPISQLIK
jgi:nicotinamidase-related amidase